MTSSHPDRLLDRPFRRDRIVLLFVGALGLVALWGTSRYVEWGAAFNPVRALTMAELLVRAAFWLWLLLLVVPAFLRRSVRRRRWRPVHGRRTRPRWASWWWTSGHRTPQGPSGGAGPLSYPAPHAGGTWTVGGPPLVRSATVAPRAVPPGQPVTASCTTTGAESVAVGELTGLPPDGSAAVVPPSSGPLTVTAMNAHGTSSARTDRVEVRPGPRIDLTSVPSPPPVPVPTAAPPPPVPGVPRLRLDDVVERQRTRRLSTPRPLAPGAALPPAPALSPDPDPRSSA